MVSEKIEVTFNESIKKEVLDMFNKSVDKEGMLVEKEHPEQRVLTQEGEEISLDEFGGIKKGSEIFIKNDLISMIKLSKD